MKKSKNFLYIIVGLAVGSLLTLATSVVLAHGGDLSLIHACVRTNNGNIRIVGANDNCNGNESPLDWPKTGGSSPIICTQCSSRDVLVRLNSSNFLNKNFDLGNLSGSYLPNEDFTSSSFIKTVLSFFVEGSNFTDANFTEANLRNANVYNANFTRANFTNADLINANFSGSNLTDANITNAIWGGTICPDGTNSDNNGNTCEGHLTP